MKENLSVAIGLADSCELMSLALAFPDEALASALVDGAFSSDVKSCLADAGVEDPLAFTNEKLANLENEDVPGLLDRLRKGYSILYLSPGATTPVWPYEAAFRFVADGREGTPSLFRSSVTKAVEQHMREAGVLPKDARTEPADSVWNELSFMSYLYGSVAKALHEGREADAAEWSGRVVSFWDEHASKWLPAFMEKTMEEAPRHSFGIEYAVLAELGRLVLEAIRVDIASRGGEG